MLLYFKSLFRIRLGGIYIENKNLLQWCSNHFGKMLKSLGYEIVEVEYQPESMGNVLRFYIDNISDELVTVEDCEKASSVISDELDRTDPISESYYLEVSTPGIEREFRYPKDYRRNLDKKVVVSLYMPLNGKKEWLGILKDFNEDNIHIETKKNKEICIEREKISSIKLSLF